MNNMLIETHVLLWALGDPDRLRADTRVVLVNPDGIAIRELRLIHRDPFDCMLIAQTNAHGLTLITSDEVIPRYEVATMEA